MPRGPSYIAMLVVALLLTSVTFIGDSVSNTAWAKDDTPPVEIRIGKSEAGQLAQSVMGGKVLKVELKKKRSNNPYYRVRLLLDNGVVKQVKVNALTGTVS